MCAGVLGCASGLLYLHGQFPINVYLCLKELASDELYIHTIGAFKQLFFILLFNVDGDKLVDVAVNFQMLTYSFNF